MRIYFLAPDLSVRFGHRTNRIALTSMHGWHQSFYNNQLQMYGKSHIDAIYLVFSSEKRREKKNVAK